MSFKDIVNTDMSIFINPDEFGETHRINGQQIEVVVDADRLSWRHSKDYEGNMVGDLLYFVNISVYPWAKPKIGEVQTFDGKPYTVFDVKEPDGMYEIILQRNFS